MNEELNLFYPINRMKYINMTGLQLFLHYKRQNIENDYLLNKDILICLNFHFMKGFIIWIFLGILILGTAYGQENMDSVDFNKWAYKELDSLVMIPYSKGDYKEALFYMQYGAKKAEIELGKMHRMYEKYIGNVAVLSFYLGDYKQAEEFYLEQLDIVKKVFGENHKNYANTANNLGSLYTELNRYEESEYYLLIAKRVWKITLGIYDPLYATSLNNLAELYKNQGYYEKAEPLFKSALSIRKGKYGDKHSLYASSLNSLGGLYDAMGIYNEAESLYLKAKTIWKETLGETHPNYSMVLNNLADVYQVLKKYEQAEKLYMQASKIKKEKFGEQSLQYSCTLNNLAVLYQRMELYEKAKPLLAKALEIDSIVVGVFSPTYASTLSNLAVLYQRLKNYKKAEKFYQKALEIKKEVLGQKHISYINLLASLANLYQNIKKYEQAGKLNSEIKDLTMNLLDVNYDNLNEKKQFQFLATMQRNFEGLHRMVVTFPSDTKRVKEIQEVYLKIKGLSLSRANTIRELVQSTNGSLLNEIYNNWQYTRYQIGKATTLSIQSRQEKKIDLDSLLQKGYEQEQELAKQSKVIEKQLKYAAQKFTFEDLKNKLSSHEVCIDILHFPCYKNDGGEIDSIVYYALLTNSTDDAPKCIKLGIEKRFKNILKFQVSLKGISYVSDTELSSELYQVLWAPLLPYLDGIKTIHLSASGVLHKVAFGALKVDSSKEVYLVDQYNLHYYGTLRDFIFSKKKKIIQQDKNIVLFGGANFSLDSSSLVKFVDSSNLKNENLPTDESPQSLAIEGVDSSRGKDFVNLKGSLKEVEQIHKLFEQKKWVVQTFSKDKALEGKLKIHSGKNAPSILHIATHGYFFSKPKQSVYYRKAKRLRERLKYHPNPLFRSGLAFSGANYAWNGGVPIQGLDDGILMAYEVAGLDLYNTQLVVLSACETGKGDIDNNEGVLGLQRAFKTAGVDQLIISLWKVNDIATSLLMEAFYRNYLKGQSTSEALKNAQNYLQKYKNKEGDLIYSKPYFWAGFILIE